jgi:PAS domain S-box-containing protein
VELGSAPLRETGETIGLQLALLDVTQHRRAERELRESERRVRLITDALPVLVSFVDRDERYRFVNAAYEAWFGAPAAEVRGRRVREVLGEAAYAVVAPYVASALGGASAHFVGELPYRVAGPRYVSVTYSPDVQEDGSVRGFYATVLDLTELYRAQQALRTAAAETALAEQRERRKLAADLHDDVAQLLSLASLKLRELEDAGAARVREELLAGAAGLVTAARERVSSLSFQLSPPVLHDVGLVAAAEWLAEDLQRRYGLEVRIEAEAELDDLDEATAVTLFRALRELLINVARHAGCSEARVRLARDGGGTRVEVEDAGLGFVPESGWTGFGLRSVCDRVEHMGGSVEIDAAPGRGTRVRVRAPAHAPAARGAEGPESGRR